MALTKESLAVLFPDSKLQPLVGYLFKKVAGKGAFTSTHPSVQEHLARARCVRLTKLVKFLISVEEHGGAHGLDAIKTEADAVLFINFMRLRKTPLIVNCRPLKDAQGETVHYGGARVYYAGGTGGNAEAAASEHLLWRYEHTTAWRHVQVGLVVAAVISCNMYTLWPDWARSIVWWISVSMLLFIIGTIALQLLLFVVVWPSGYDFWLLPNFTSEEAPIWMLFSPLYTLERNPSGHPALRVGIVALLGAAVFMLTRMPQSEFQEFLSSQKKIVDDLYSGALLTDGKEGAAGLVAGGKFENPMNPFGSKWGPGSGRYGSMRPAHIPSLDEVEKMTAEEVENAAVVDDEVAAAAEAPPEAGAASEGHRAQ